jgi:secreted trypsin-like serine protease
MEAKVGGRAVLLAVLIVLALARSAPAQEEIRPLNRRIVGGEQTDISQHPWQVALTVRIDDTDYLCGGSIIGELWIVTAAHCFGGEEGKASDVRAKAGETDYTAAGVWSQIERVIIHEAYDRSTQQNDIALLKLKSPIAGRVIKLATASLMVPLGQPLEVTGWGATEEAGKTSPALLRAIVPVADIATCNAPAAYDGRIKAGMMCAGYREGGVDSCQGDSGGPLVWRTPDGPVLVGIVSWGDGCARKLKYGIYTSISAFRDWIDRVLAGDGN